jgi:hypothetical protein
MNLLTLTLLFTLSAVPKAAAAPACSFKETFAKGFDWNNCRLFPDEANKLFAALKSTGCPEQDLAEGFKILSGMPRLSEADFNALGRIFPDESDKFKACRGFSETSVSDGGTSLSQLPGHGRDPAAFADGVARELLTSARSDSGASSPGGIAPQPLLRQAGAPGASNARTDLGILVPPPGAPLDAERRQLAEFVLTDAAAVRRQENSDVARVAKAAFSDGSLKRQGNIDQLAAQLAPQIRDGRSTLADALAGLSLSSAETSYALKKIASNLGANRAADVSEAQLRQAIDQKVGDFAAFTRLAGPALDREKAWALLTELYYSAPDPSLVLPALERALQAEAGHAGPGLAEALRRRVTDEFLAAAKPKAADLGVKPSSGTMQGRVSGVAADSAILPRAGKLLSGARDNSLLDWYIGRRTTPELVDFLKRNRDVSVRVYGGDTAQAFQDLERNGFTEISPMYHGNSNDVQKYLALNPSTGARVLAMVAPDGEGVLLKVTARLVGQGVDSTQIEVLRSKTSPRAQFAGILREAGADPDIVEIGRVSEFRAIEKREHRVQPYRTIDTEALSGELYKIDGRQVLSLSINGNYLYNDRAGDLLSAVLDGAPKPRSVIFVGIGGSLHGNDILKGDIVIPRTFSESSGQSLRPAPAIANYAEGVFRSRGLLHAEGIHAGVAEVSVDSPLRETPDWFQAVGPSSISSASTSKDVVEQELFGVARALGGRNNVRFYGVLDISDVVGSKENLSQQDAPHADRNKISVVTAMEYCFEDALHR